IFVSKFELRDGKICFPFTESAIYVSEKLAIIEFFDEFFHVGIFRRHKNKHTELSIAIRQLDTLNVVILNNIELFLDIHKISLKVRTVRPLKGHLSSTLGIEVFLPAAFEIDSVDQIHDHIRRDVINDSRDLPVGIFAYPIVNGFRGLRTTEIQRADFGMIKTTVYIQRSEEHTSELQSRENLVCRLL